jgi:hypothetical protein
VTVGERGGFWIKENPAPVNISFPVLAQVQQGAMARVTNNTSVGGEVLLPGLTTVDGTLVWQGNSFSTLELPLLFEVTGSLLVMGEMQLGRLALSSLFSVTGNLRVSGNRRLSSVTFPSLSEVPGILTVEYNPLVMTLAFPNVVERRFSATISGNQALREVAFENLQILSGELVVDDNPSLVDFRVPSLVGMSPGSRLVISSNPSLVELDLRTLDCAYDFLLELLNNQGLTTVRLLPSGTTGCSLQIKSEGNNANLVFLNE